MYHFINISVTMRDCYSIEDAIKKCSELLPQHPDNNTVHMESWVISNVYESSTGKRYVEKDLI